MKLQYYDNSAEVRLNEKENTTFLLVQYQLGFCDH